MSSCYIHGSKHRAINGHNVVTMQRRNKELYSEDLADQALISYSLFLQVEKYTKQPCVFSGGNTLREVRYQADHPSVSMNVSMLVHEVRCLQHHVVMV